MKYENHIFEGRVRIAVSENEVRVWVCNDQEQCIARVKCIGEVYLHETEDGPTDVTVTAKKKSAPKFYVN